MPEAPRVALFVTCLVDLFRPTIGFAAVKLLEQAGCTVGLSWNNFQEERWAKWDEPAIKGAQPRSNYIMIKGNKSDANADFLRGGYNDVVGAAPRIKVLPRGMLGAQAAGLGGR